jgi:hypothetical protein
MHQQTYEFAICLAESVSRPVSFDGESPECGFVELRDALDPALLFVKDRVKKSKAAEALLRTLHNTRSTPWLKERLI